MAADGLADRRERERAEHAAAEAGAIDADEVRKAIEIAERAAEDLQRQALDRTVADGEAVQRMAAMVIDRIDMAEAKVGALLQTLRDEVSRTAATVDRQEAPNDAPPLTDPEAPDEQATRERLPHAGSPGPPVAPPARRRRFRRGRRGVRDCAVCGRHADARKEGLEGWCRSGNVSLCPDCQQEGWQLPAGATLPYRPARRAGGTRSS